MNLMFLLFEFLCVFVVCVRYGNFLCVVDEFVIMFIVVS